MDKVETAESEVADPAALPSGRLRIHAPTSFGTYYLTPLIALHTQQFSDVSQSISSSVNACRI
ncbi:DNA-binding transcriptional LysR family regulator [Paraburkholderia sp. GAS448]|jgi:DNA-binding transcriptional LysR family regulator|uniref:hypothetical protein n=1 Tax=Paraburkholderia sp. GAS448 TaxID=3035136 RepID=UPI003D22D0DD